MRNKRTVSLDPDSDVDHRFACNICFEQVSEPVVTRCGHLYCWPCLFQWLEPGMNPQDRTYLSQSYPWRIQDINPSRRICPVCKSECSVTSVIPIYVREDESTSKEEKRPLNSDSQSTGHVDNTNNDEVVPEECMELPNSVQNDEQQTIGIRQRRNRSQEDASEDRHHDVPSRPQPPRMPSSHMGQQHFVHGRQGTNIITQIIFLLSSLQTEQGNQFNQPSATVGSNMEQRAPAIPSLHNRRLDDTDFSSNSTVRGNDSVESAMTELLGRVLLVMGSVVILFLLVF